MNCPDADGGIKILQFIFFKYLQKLPKHIENILMLLIVILGVF